MAFSWLDAVGAAGSAIGIARDLRGPETPASLPYLEEAARRARDIEIALTQPDLGKYRGLVDAEQGEINRATSQAGSDLMRMDRESRVRSASGLGIFQDDRRDETIAREMIRQRETSREKARERTRNYLTQALEANKVSLGGFESTAVAQQYGLDQKYNRQNLALEGITTLAPKIGGLFDSLLDGTPTYLQTYGNTAGKVSPRQPFTVNP